MGASVSVYRYLYLFTNNVFECVRAWLSHMKTDSFCKRSRDVAGCSVRTVWDEGQEPGV